MPPNNEKRALCLVLGEKVRKGKGEMMVEMGINKSKEVSFLKEQS
jgi:hypothetical protein